MADKLIVNGLGRPFDGEYEFDVTGMLTLGHPDCLTNREGHRVKGMTGLRMGEFTDAVKAGDTDVIVALAAVVLARHGKQIDEDLLWDAPIGSGITIVPEEVPDEGDALPPENEPGENAPTGQPTTSGGESLSPKSEPPNGNGPSRTGFPLSETPTSAPASVPQTLGS